MDQRDQQNEADQEQDIARDHLQHAALKEPQGLERILFRLHAHLLKTNQAASRDEASRNGEGHAEYGYGTEQGTPVLFDEGEGGGYDLPEVTNLTELHRHGVLHGKEV